jgi:hypothetical protein
MVCRIADKFRTPETETARSCSTRERQHIGRGDGVYCRQAIARREVDDLVAPLFDFARQQERPVLVEVGRSAATAI